MNFKLRLKQLAGICLLLAWPAAVIGGFLWENHVCGWPRGLWEDSVCKSPNKARPHGLLGAAYLEKKEFNRAIEQFELADAAARQHPDGMSRTVGATSLANIAYIRIAMKDYAGADAALERARNDYPPDHLVLNNSIELFLVTGQIDRAFSLAQTAIATFPDSFALAWTMGDVYAELGQCEKQREWIRRSIAIDKIASISGFPVRACVEY